jgi:hypothetical protein
MRSIGRCGATLGVLVVGTLLAPRVEAVPITIANHSFESPVLADGGATANSIPGWMIDLSGSGNAGVFNPSGNGVTPNEFNTPVPDGTQIAFTAFRLFSQTLVDVLLADTLYTLQVEVGNRKVIAGFPATLVQLWAGTTLLDTESPNPGEGAWVTTTLSYLALASDPALGSALQIRLSADGNQANFDNVRLEAVSQVPEPATVGLVSVGAAWLIRRRRRAVA